MSNEKFEVTRIEYDHVNKVYFFHVLIVRSGTDDYIVVATHEIAHHMCKETFEYHHRRVVSAYAGMELGND